jgi:hypothetical protein
MTSYDDATMVMRRDHVTQVSENGWGCSCGAGRVLSLSGAGRARAAANQHLRAEHRKLIARL